MNSFVFDLAGFEHFGSRLDVHYTGLCFQPSGGQISHISRSRYDTFVDLWTLYKIRHTWVTNPLHILYTRASNNLNFVEFPVFAGTPSKNAAIYRGFRSTVLCTAYYCTTSEKNSGIGLSTLELFTFKHARAYRYARFGLSGFSRVHAHLQTRNWS